MLPTGFSFGGLVGGCPPKIPTSGFLVIGAAQPLAVVAPKIPLPAPKVPAAAGIGLLL